MKNTFLIHLGVCCSLFGDAYEHQILSVQEANVVLLDDGSVWQVSDKDAKKLKSFLNKPLSFQADESWLISGVNCRLVNKSNKDYLNIALISPPESYENKSHWIAYLEPKKSILFLDNGSIFSLYDNDREYFKNWRVDDFVITGDYSSWMSQNKHILFNYRTKEFVFGDLH